jgi:hypothetical protein
MAQVKGMRGSTLDLSIADRELAQQHHDMISTTCTKPAHPPYSSICELWFSFFMRLKEHKVYVFPSQRRLH